MTHNIDGDPRPIEHSSFAATLMFSLAMTGLGMAAGWQMNDNYHNDDHNAIVQDAEAVATAYSRLINGNTTEVAGVRATAQAAEIDAHKRGLWSGANRCLEQFGVPTLSIPTDIP